MALILNILFCLLPLLFVNDGKPILYFTFWHYLDNSSNLNTKLNKNWFVSFRKPKIYFFSLTYCKHCKYYGCSLYFTTQHYSIQTLSQHEGYLCRNDQTYIFILKSSFINKQVTVDNSFSKNVAITFLCCSLNKYFTQMAFLYSLSFDWLLGIVQLFLFLYFPFHLFSCLKINRINQIFNHWTNISLIITSLY